MTITERDIAEALKALPPPPTSADAAQAQVMSRVAHQVRRRRVTRVALATATAAALVLGLTMWPAGGGRTGLVVTPAEATPTSRAPVDLPSDLRGLAELTGAELRPLAGGVLDGREWVIGIGTQRGFDEQACILAHDEIFDRLALCFPDPLPGPEPTWQVLGGRHGASVVIGAAPAVVEGRDVTEVWLTLSGRSVQVPVHRAWVSDASVFFVHVFQGKRGPTSVQLVSGDDLVSSPRMTSAAPPAQPPCQEAERDCVGMVEVDPPQEG